MSIAAIILAAGEGKRVSQLGPKPLLLLNGKPFLKVIFEKCCLAGFDPIIIVTNNILKNAIVQLGLEARLVINPTPELGMLSSVRYGLSKIENLSSGFLLNPVDFPLVELNTYHILFEQHQQNSGHVIKSVYSNHAGHPVIFPSCFYNELQTCPLSEGARYIQKKYPDKVTSVVVEDSGVLKNINTPQAYAAYCRSPD